MVVAVVVLLSWPLLLLPMSFALGLGALVPPLAFFCGFDDIMVRSIERERIDLAGLLVCFLHVRWGG